VDLNLKTLAFLAFATFLGGLAVQNFGIRIAHRFKLLDHPSARRRHRESTPIVGGVGVFATWLIAIALWCIKCPSWYMANFPSLLLLSGGIVMLLALGVVDDLKGLSPSWKLLVEFFVAGTVIAYEPKVHEICMIWQREIGILVWPIAAIWIVGVTNAINLIDGLDGLAGGMSLLVSCSLLILSLWTGPTASIATVTMGLLAPAIVAFLRYNWAPARVFLGDNGSLPIGFLLSTSSLMCRPANRSWVMLASLIIMLGYPILDMGLAVLRRWRKGFPLFKADRNHLHFRVQRLGASVSQTAFILLCIGMYLQVVSLSVNLTSQATASMGVALAVFSITILLTLVRGIEHWRVNKLYLNVLKGAGAEALGTPQQELQSVLNVDLEPLLEAGLFEEQKRYTQLVSSLELMLSTMIRPSDSIYYSNRRISVLFGERIPMDQREATLERFRGGLEKFLDLYNLQCSLASLPMAIEDITLIRAGGASRASTEKKAA
jgi:UDP-GlcNAc:undecaprenyl-phosphate/decaprenyl-phosphate GlcNAc-1-phosphate transferase